MRLDTPEEVAAWIAERKRRWPTAARVAEKKRKLEEAMANGGLHPDHLALMGNKRFRPPSSDAEVNRTRRGRGGAFRFGGAGRGRGRGRMHGTGATRGGVASSAQTLPLSRPPKNVNDTEPPRPASVPSAPPTRSVASHLGSDDDDDDDDDDDEAPEVVSAKRPPVIEAYGSSSDAELDKSKVVNGNSQPGPTISSSFRSGPAAAGQSVNCPRKAPPPQPKKPQRNLFGVRPSLLRNVSEQRLLHYLASPVLTVVYARL